MDIINLALGSRGLKEAVMRPLSKKPSLDTVDPSNYGSVSNPSILGKVVEREAEEQLDFPGGRIGSRLISAQLLVWPWGGNSTGDTYGRCL